MTVNDENLPRVMQLLDDENEPAQVRRAALQALQTASFSVVTFAPMRSQYMAILRKVATDPDAELRASALGILARRKDGFAQRKLLEGLQDPDRALLPPEQALQLLSFDAHAESYEAARAIVATPPNADSRREALRLLAADASSAPLFDELLRDKTETTAIRQLSASALHAIDPAKLQRHAREILLDPDESDEIQTASLAALTQFGNAEAVAGDDTLLQHVAGLSRQAPAALKQMARRFLRQHGGKAVDDA
jgi:hypothetical protein